ncbi:unnamed protein product [Linum trigynum]|uniref:Reverse transcriptase n=1 Tax=Linum trigynum TaxID=586398 RepID=A0AAV2DBW1_9ROSI
MSGSEQKLRADRYGFALGRFPVRYLGVPLSSGKLTVAACKPLIDKIVARISSWKSEFLSYAGRVELVSSVLYSLHQYWMAGFPSP